MNVLRRYPRRRWLFPLSGLCLLLMAGFLARSRFQKTAPVLTWPRIQQAVDAKQWNEAERMLERWLGHHPRHGEALVMLANVYLMEERTAEAAKLLEAVPESSRLWAPARINLGELAIKARRAGQAEEIFRSLARRDPGALRPRQRLIYLFSMQQRTAEARELLWQLKGIQNDPRVLVDLVLEALRDEQDVRGIAPELEEFFSQTPDDPFLRRAWGLSLLYQGRANEALPHLEAAAGSLTNDPSGRFALAECRIVLGQTVNVDESLGPKPDDPDAAAAWWFYRGRLEEALGQRESAVASFGHVLELRPNTREALFRRGNLLEQTGRRAEGARDLARAKEIAGHLKNVRREHEQIRRGGLPKDALLYERLGRLCRQAGLFREACAWFEECLALDSSRSEARTGLHELDQASGDDPIAMAKPLRRPDAQPRGSDPKNVTATAPTAPRLPAPELEDVSSAAGIDYRYDHGASGRIYLADTMGGGVGLIDYDGDGWLDIYFVNGCGLSADGPSTPSPNRLYRNLGNFTFLDVTAKAGVGGLGYGMGCAVGDYDNDGHDDLVVTGLTRTILYHNRGDGTFEDATAKAGLGASSGRWTTAAGFADLDRDGDLDLVLITYVEIAPDDTLQCRDYAGKFIHCSPARYPAQADLLFRNNGNGTFTEVSQAAGFEAPNGRGLGLAIADLDGDGKLDIFVANDASPDFLFRNLGGMRFEETGASAGVATNGSGKATASMGVVAQDLDGDGKLDLFITNLVNESSTFFHNLGNGLFQDATLGAGLDAPSRPKTGFGDAAFDADNDGRLDLFVTNGHVDDRPWANSPMAQTPLLFRGAGRGRFEQVRDDRAGSYLSRRVVGRGAAAGDLDNDGRIDLVVVHRDAPAVLLRNQTAGGHWLGIKLKGTRSGSTPIGARVSCRVKDRTIVRFVASGTGYLSAHDPRVWFGLGPQPIVESLKVEWPSGLVQTWSDLAADRILKIVEGRDQARESVRKKDAPR